MLPRVVRPALVTAALCLAGTVLSGPASAAPSDTSFPTVTCSVAFDAEAGTVFSLNCFLGPASRDIGPAWVRNPGTGELFWCDDVSYYYGGPLSPFRVLSGSGCRPEPAASPAL